MEADAGPGSPHAPREGRAGFAQSGTASVRASRNSPIGPVLRANPFSEVTDLVCRLPLPTLFYRPEAVHLGDLLRIWVRARAKITPPPSDFHGPTRAHRTRQETSRFAGHRSLSPGEPIPGSPPLTKKRELFPGLEPASPSSFALPRQAPKGRSPRRGSGMLTRFPFGRPGAMQGHRPTSERPSPVP